eukprot:Transcript_10452.p4 GENE.Transcript_10452~~Transcript_10452.p4  ORF type:complete len:87 (-),score=9.94 Transcript_10452:293-553(-)
MRARLSQAAAACMSGAEKWRGGGPAAATAATAAAAGLAAPTLADLSSCAERAEGPPRPEEIGESLALRSRLRLRLRSRLLLSLLLR